MKQIEALTDKNGKEVGTKEYFKGVNDRGFMLYLPRKLECYYYDNIVAVCKKINSTAAEMLRDIQKQKKSNPEIFPEDARLDMIALCEGLDDICKIAGCSHGDLTKCVKLLEGVKCGSKKHHFTHRETQGMYGGMSRLELYLDKKTASIFGRPLPQFYKNNGGWRKYGKALKADLDEVAAQLYSDINSAKPGEVGMQETYRDNFVIAQAQLNKCGVSTKGDWSAEVNKFTYRDISAEMRKLFDEVYQKSILSKYIPNQAGFYFAGRHFEAGEAKYVYFAAQVMPHGKYDLKSKKEWKDPAFIFDGKHLRQDDPGNILYGYFGTAMGFSAKELLCAGGIVQVATKSSSWNFIDSNFDDPRDQEMIALGIEYFKKDHGESELYTIQHELENVQELLQKEFSDILNN